MKMMSLSQVKQPIKIPDNVVYPGLRLPPIPLQKPEVIFQRTMAKALGDLVPLAKTQVERKSTHCHWFPR